MEIETPSSFQMRLQDHDIEPRVHDLSGVKQTALAWVKEHAELVNQWVERDGFALLRNLNIVGTNQFCRVLETLFNEPLSQYTFRSSPRTALKNNIYTTTEYHSDLVISQHNENSYTNKWPLKMGFFCVIPAKEGGHTPLADSRLVYIAMPKPLRDKFERKGIIYTRNYGDIDLPWQEVFQTEERKNVEEYCLANGIKFHWLGENRLRTEQWRPAIARHPKTLEKVWFNQAHLFHRSSLGEQLDEQFKDGIAEDYLPRNAAFGDGSPILDSEIQCINEIYRDLTFSIPWQKNDILLLDNMLFTHGRQAFKGPRKVLVGMAKTMTYVDENNIN